MRILFIGDTHGSQDINKIRPEVVKKLSLTSDDIIIHCGDIGVPWIESNDEMLGYWANLPCQVIVCLGNHENYNWIKAQALVKRYGAEGYLMAPNLFAPKIGSILTIQNKSFWFYPGAYSIDYARRELNKTLFKQELPLKSESDKAIQNLINHGQVDVIISHDGPRKFIMDNFGYPIADVSDGYLKKTNQKRGERVHTGFALNEVIKNDALYKQWYFGHHHRDFSKGKIRCLMEEMILWDLTSDSKNFIK